MIKFTKGVSATALMMALAACSNNTDAFKNSDINSSNSVSAMSDTITITEAELKDNPFVKPWETPYGVPPFDIIKDSHFMPAIKAGILELRKEIDEIVLNNDLPSFENTIVALDLAGNQLSKVSSTFGNITGTDTNDNLRSLQGKISPLLTREYNKIQFNEDLFARVKFVYEKRDSLNPDEQDARLLELTHTGFGRAGAN